jgi:hypothetical protein
MLGGDVSRFPISPARNNDFIPCHGPKRGFPVFIFLKSRFDVCRHAVFPFLSVDSFDVRREDRKETVNGFFIESDCRAA